MLQDIFSSLGVTSWLVLFLALAISLYFLTQKKKNLPPSPGISLPIIGHLYLMEKNPRQQFDRWAKQLGGVFSLRMCSHTVVVLNGYDVLKEALIKQADYFSDRPHNTFSGVAIPHANHGVVIANGKEWKELRTTSLSILRNFGMGKNILAEKINEEVSVYLEKISKLKGKPSNLKNLTNMSVSNVICSIIFGKRFDLDDSRFIHMMNMFNELFVLLAGSSILNFMPSLRFIPFDPFQGMRIIYVVTEVRKFVREIVEEKRAEYDPDNLDNFITSFIHEQKKKQKAGQPTHLDEVNLLRTLDGLFAAGSETTSTTISWFMLYMLYYPDIQAKVFKEIKENIGTERSPNMMDKSNLTYLNAVIMETQRIASIVPLSVPHECNTETVINGYTIPKGAQVFPNLDSVLRDEKVWGDPQNFRPERFLDASGNLTKHEELVFFSLGRRICLGEAMAKMELFLYLSSLLQRFELLPVDPKNLPPLEDVFGITAAPAAYEIRCVERKY